MIKEKITIINKLGLHARAAAKLAATCSRFSSTIKAGHSDKLVDAKSVMSLMLLAAGQDCCLNFEFDGQDEQDALDQVRALITERFGEDE
ncbi:MAG TPA: HPr family phosphocarrier protein [Porticoccaceae bacterium]|nr:HPr family phosphocarrier protein [Porticoccaceae bacterium]